MNYDEKTFTEGVKMLEKIIEEAMKANHTTAAIAIDTMTAASCQDRLKAAGLPYFENVCQNGWKTESLLPGVIADFESDSPDPSVVLVANTIDMADDELLLFPYHKEVPEGCAGGWVNINGESVGVYTKVKSPSYCIYIDTEGYGYCRYISLPECWRDMYADIVADAAKEREEREAAELAAQMAEEAANYREYCAHVAKWESLMKPIDSSASTRQQKATQAANIRRMLNAYFPGVKFSVTYSVCFCHEIKIEWTDGPTVEEVKNTDIYLFQTGTIRTEIDDSTTRERFENTEFSKRFGLYCDSLAFSRRYSSAFDEVKADALAVWDSIAPGREWLTSYAPEYCKILDALHLNIGHCYDLHKCAIAEKVCASLSMV